ncbi:MAG TPA: hypothetical protein V6D17_07880 [Candidatus Obscuribacterales bacterium]
MRISFTPDKAMTLKVRYNGEEIFARDLEPGEQTIEIETPKVTGKAEALLVVDGKEIPIATATYTYEDEPEDGTEEEGDGETGCGCV